MEIGFFKQANAVLSADAAAELLDQLKHLKFGLAGELAKDIVVSVQGANII